MSHQPSLLDVQGLRVVLPTGAKSEIEAVANVSLRVGEGERIGIVGESGSGKSVTGRAIAGLLPTSDSVRVTGSIRFQGEQLVNATPKAWQTIRERKVGMIFQDPLTFLNPTMRIGAQVAEAVRTSVAKSRAARKAAVIVALSLAGLQDPEHIYASYPHELSGGMRQRVLIAIAIAKQPELIIADEPTTALDATVQKVVMDNLNDTVAKLQTALILISHDLAVVSQMVDRIYVMYGGRIVESGATQQILFDPQHSYTQALVRSMRSLMSDDDELYTIPTELREQWKTEGQIHVY